MEQVWEWGIKVIQAMQKFSCKPLDYFAVFIHYVFNTPIYIFLIMIFCWCVNYRKTVRVGAITLFSCAINSAVKEVLRAPRPYQFSSNNFNPETYTPKKGLVDYSDSPVFKIEENDYSTPSGHSQTAATYWPLFARDMNCKKIWKLLLAILLPVIVAISRSYLGVHYPTDILGGLLAGYIISIGYIIWGAKIESLFKKPRKIIRILIVALVVVVLNVLVPKDTSMPGALFGFLLGYILLDDGKNFDAKSGSWWKKLLRFILGAVMVAVVYLGLKKLFPGKEENLGQLFRFIRYGLTGFVISFVAPIIFVKIRLAEPEKE
ncbi:MAG: phosphatase PAP2 family protein [Treponemataceae bacterium]